MSETPVTPTQKWLDAVSMLALNLEMEPASVTEKLLGAKIVKAPNDIGAATLCDEEAVPNDDLFAAFSDVPKPVVRKAAKEMRKAAKPVVEVPATPAVPMLPTAPVMTFGATYIIPDVPAGSNFLAALSASKTLTVDDVTIRAALEALYADNLGLSDIPERLAEQMEAFADTIEEPVGDQFMEVLKFVRERRYAEINVDSRLVTKARKAEVLKRLRLLPKAVAQFHSALSAWNEQYESERRSNPLGVLGGRVIYPPADDVIAAAEIVVDCLKKAFSGLGVQVAKAMAYEGLKIRETLERPELPALTGSPNRELMLKKLNCSLRNADERTEHSIAKYVIFVATTVYRNMPSGQEGPILEALYRVGQTILPWMRGDSTSTDRSPVDPTPIGGKRGGGRDTGPYGNADR
ncbi:MAG: hypothetical protein WCV84_04915 [Patescibacteria group bacterium]